MTASVQPIAFAGEIRHIDGDGHLHAMCSLEHASDESLVMHDERGHDMPLESMVVRVLPLGIEDDAQHAIVQFLDVGNSVHENVCDGNWFYQRKIGVHSRLLTALSLSKAFDAQLGGYATGSRFREAPVLADCNGWLISGYASPRASFPRAIA